MLAADHGEQAGLARSSGPRYRQVVIIHQPAADPARLLGPWGRRPADRLATALGACLDDRFHFVRRPRVEGTWLAGAVVGPGGTWTLADLAEAGRFRKRNGHWYRWNTSTDSWVPWEAGAVTEARLAGHRLERTLDRAGLPSAVEAVLVTGSRTTVTCDGGERAGVHVHAQSGAEELASRMSRRILTPAQVGRIVALLDPRRPVPAGIPG